MSLVRLFVTHPLGPGQPVPLTREQAHYLFGVMRLTEGAEVAVFNGADGEWRAVVAEAGKKGGVLNCVTQAVPQGEPPDLWLCFAPVKKARTDFIVEKAVEMGVRRILPVATEFTNSERFRQDRHQANAVEAAEQCGATFVPEVAELVRLDRLLADWPRERHLMFCDETRAGPATTLAGAQQGPWAILIGPEGGFSAPERARLATLKTAHAVSLGPRVLRADTAAVAAMTLWQAALGDWR
ncbi:16S rRNA (uracil(1498)-N(3))-methyltransferase [Citreimonas sp.]|uniref:16S rRNA (uracil(1498)-N(3))-methyltransferase n=1 Tax=Citreimonas sp. TaxID=3036715 RepID=UPI00405911FC